MTINRVALPLKNAYRNRLFDYLSSLSSTTSISSCLSSAVLLNSLILDFFFRDVRISKTPQNHNTFRNNIRRYILRGDEDTGMDIDMDIDKFEITKFDYRKLFDKRAIQNVSYQEILRKMFEIENVFDLDMDHVRHYKDHPDKWKELFIFFCVMPFTEYEFQGKDGNLLNPDTLHIACPSDATDNLLIGTFSDIEFESLNQEILEDRLAANLQCILKTDLFSNTFSEDQRKKVITMLLGVCFKQDYKLVKHIGRRLKQLTEIFF